MLERAHPFIDIKFFDADGTLMNMVPTPRTDGADLPPTMARCAATCRPCWST
jgi:hypothetical protein